MVITKREDVTKTGKVSVKYSEENGSVLGEVSNQYLFNFFFFCVRGVRGGGGRVGVGVGSYLSFSEKGRVEGWGWALIRRGS